MFGKKRKRDEKYKDIFDHIYQQRVTFETSVSQVENGRERVHEDICHVMKSANQLKLKNLPFLTLTRSIKNFLTPALTRAKYLRNYYLITNAKICNFKGLFTAQYVVSVAKL